MLGWVGGRRVLKKAPACAANRLAAKGKHRAFLFRYLAGAADARTVQPYAPAAPGNRGWPPAVSQAC